MDNWFNNIAASRGATGSCSNGDVAVDTWSLSGQQAGSYICGPDMAWDDFNSDVGAQVNEQYWNRTDNINWWERNGGTINSPS
jgi:hypothetical protein